MHNILDADDLRETADYIESISDASDNTNGAELTECSARLCRESNEERSDNHGKTEQTPRAAPPANVGRSSRSHGRKLRGTVT